jgi:hypothetical protein
LKRSPSPPPESLLEIGIGEDEGRRLAAEFEADALEVALRRIDDRAAGLGRAGEGDLIDIHVAASAAPAVRP